MKHGIYHMQACGVIARRICIFRGCPGSTHVSETLMYTSRPFRRHPGMRTCERTLLVYQHEGARTAAHKRGDDHRPCNIRIVRTCYLSPLPLEHGCSSSNDDDDSYVIHERVYANLHVFELSQASHRKKKDRRHRIRRTDIHCETGG